MTTYFRDGTFAHQLEQLPAQVDFPMWQELLKGYSAEAQRNKRDLSVIGIRLYGLQAVKATLGEDYAEHITNTVEDALLDITASNTDPISPHLPVTLKKFAMRDLDSYGKPLHSRVNSRFVPVTEYWTMMSVRRERRRDIEHILANTTQTVLDNLQIDEQKPLAWQAVGGTTLRHEKLATIDPFQAAYEALGAQAAVRRSGRV